MVCGLSKGTASMETDEELQKKMLEQFHLLDTVSNMIFDSIKDRERPTEHYIYICASLLCGFVYTSIEKSQQDMVFEAALHMFRALWNQGKKELDDLEHTKTKH